MLWRVNSHSQFNVQNIFRASSRCPAQSKSFWFLADRVSEGLNQRGSKWVPWVGFVFTLVCIYIPLRFSLSTDSTKTQQRGVGLQEFCRTYLHLNWALVCLPGECNWRLSLDWNWLHKVFNNERPLVFLQWRPRSA